MGAKTIRLHRRGSIRNMHSGRVKGCGRSGRAGDIGPVTIGRNFLFSCECFVVVVVVVVVIVVVIVVVVIVVVVVVK